MLKGSAVAAGAITLGGAVPAVLGGDPAAAQSGAVRHVWVGAVTPRSAWVRGKVTGSSVRLAVADHPDLARPAFYGPVSSNSDGIVSIEATGLDPDRPYWFALEVDGTIDGSATGRFRTHPRLGEPAEFAFAAASCGGHHDSTPGRVSNHAVYNRIRQHPTDPLFFAHLGDLHYRDIGSGVYVDGHGIGRYREAYDDVLAQPRQHLLYRSVPIEYIWDDHDYGPNNSDRTSPGRDNACRAYRERVPHYPLPAGGGANPIYHRFQVGRLLFVATDLRSERAPNSDPAGPSKSMLGTAQKAWLDEVLGSSDAAALVWLNTCQWMGASGDSWPAFAHERDELVQMFGDHGWLDRMFMVTGDKHALAIDTGGGNQWGGFPLFMFAALDANWDPVPENQYDTGPTSPGRNRYGTIEIVDEGDQIEVTGTGWIGTEPWRSHTFTIK